MTRTTTLVLLLIIAWSLPASWAQTDDAPAGDTAASEPMIAAPDAEGVFPSLMHRGDIVDFLRLLGIAGRRNIVPSPRVSGPIVVNLFDVTFDEALDTVLSAHGYVREDQGSFILVFTEAEYKARQMARQELQSRAFKLNYVAVDDVVSLISPLLSSDGAITKSPGAISSAAEQWAGGNVIVIEDYPVYLERIAEIIADLDQRPRQVLIEATILSARLNDRNELGIDFAVLGGVDFQSRISENDAVELVPSTSDIPLNGTAVNASLSAGQFSIGIVKSNIGMFIRALESVTDVVTLGNPKVITLNRQQGEVRVGGEQGYITSETTATTTTQSVENMETGTILRFRPFIMNDGYIRMEIHAEDSSGDVVLKGGFALPEKVLAQVQSNVLVQDGRTIVIGGLFRDSTSIGRSQAPILGNLPMVGPLFRSTRDQVEKEELIFLITPHIINEPEYSARSEALRNEFHHKINSVRDGLLGYGRTRLAESYYQAALDSRARGNMEAALFEAQMACHISPGYLDAVRLRNWLRGHDRIEGQYGWLRLYMRDISAIDEIIIPPHQLYGEEAPMPAATNEEIAQDMPASEVPSFEEPASRREVELAAELTMLPH